MIDTARWTIETAFQSPVKGGVKCGICPHNCVLGPGQFGVCDTRVNYRGVIYALTYGNPCSLGIEPVEKKPIYHFLPGSKVYALATGGCNFRCLNCQNAELSQSKHGTIEHYDLLPAEVIRQAQREDCPVIAFTYTEPTVFYEYMLETAQLAHAKGIKTVLMSNGFINPEPLTELCKYLDGAVIDLKAFDNKVYKKLTGGQLQPVLDTLRLLRQQGVWLEISHLVIPGHTDDKELLLKMCTWLINNDFQDTPLHFNRFSPHHHLKEVPATPEYLLHEARQIALDAGMRHVYVGELDEPKNDDTVCPQCHKTVLHRTEGRLISNHIEDSRCGFCGGEVAGRWK